MLCAMDKLSEGTIATQAGEVREQWTILAGSILASANAKPAGKPHQYNHPIASPRRPGYRSSPAGFNVNPSAAVDLVSEPPAPGKITGSAHRCVAVLGAGWREHRNRPGARPSSSEGGHRLLTGCVSTICPTIEESISAKLRVTRVLWYSKGKSAIHSAGMFGGQTMRSLDESHTSVL